MTGSSLPAGATIWMCSRGAVDKDYCAGRLAILKKHNLKLFAISHHLAGQLVCDPNNDVRSDGFAPASCAGDAEKKRAWAVEAMKNAARTARNLGVNVVNGFTGLVHLASAVQFPAGGGCDDRRWVPVLRAHVESDPGRL